MDINNYYLAAKNGDKKAEEQLFQFLTARFRLFVQRKIWNQGDGEELMQEALSIRMLNKLIIFRPGLIRS